MDKTTANHKLDQAKLNQTTVNKPAVPFRAYKIVAECNTYIFENIKCILYLI